MVSRGLPISRTCRGIIEREVLEVLHTRGWRLAVADEVTQGHLVARLELQAEEPLVRTVVVPDVDQPVIVEPALIIEGAGAPSPAELQDAHGEATARRRAREAAVVAGTEVGLAVVSEQRHGLGRVWIGWHLRPGEATGVTARRFVGRQARVRDLVATAGLNELRLVLRRLGDAP
jgi:nicotinamide mononucleotide (NMN) deamidase PncC